MNDARVRRWFLRYRDDGDREALGKVFDGAEQQRAALERAVQRLPPPYREVLILRMQGLSGGAIAERLARAPGTVRMQCLRGLELLRRSLPAGLVSGATLTLLSGRGIAAIGAELLSHGTVGVSIPAAATLAGLIMTKKMVAAATVALIVDGAWYVANDDVVPRSKAGRSATHVAAAGNREAVTVENASMDCASASDSVTGAEVVRERLAPPAPAEKVLAEGEVWVRGTVLDRQSRQPVAGASAWTLYSIFQAFPPRGDAVRTSRDGTFEFASPHDLAHTIHVWSANHAFLKQRLPRIAEVDAFECGIDVGTLELECGVEVRGRVRTEQGQPVAGAVLLFNVESALGEFRPASSLPIGWSEADGSFQLIHVPRDSTVPAWLFAFGSSGTGSASFEMPANLDLITDVEIVLLPPSSLEVAVEDDFGKPLSEAVVVVLPRGAPFSESSRRPSARLRGIPEMTQRFMAESDASGTVLLESLPAGFECVVGVRKDGYVTGPSTCRRAGASSFSLMRFLGTGTQKTFCRR